MGAIRKNKIFWNIHTITDENTDLKAKVVFSHGSMTFRLASQIIDAATSVINFLIVR